MGGTALAKQSGNYSSKNKGRNGHNQRREDIIGKYFQEMMETPLLNAQEELEIAREIEAAREEFLYLPFREASQAAYSRIYHLDRNFRKGTLKIKNFCYCEAEEPKETERKKKNHPHTYETATDDFAQKTKNLKNLERRITAAQKKSRRKKTKKIDQYLEEGVSIVQEMYLKEDSLENIVAKVRFNPQVPPEVKEHLAKKENEYLKAQQKLIKANLRLVVSVARRYMNRGIPLQDLIQEGNIGLMKGVKLYDSCYGTRFSTYATWWIRQAVRRALSNDSRAIRVPVHMVDTYHRIIKVDKALSQKLARDPTDEEVAEGADMELDKMKKIIKVFSQRMLSLQETTPSAEKRTYEHVIPDNTVVPSDKVTCDQELREELDKVMETLDTREAKVLRMRFGIGEKKYDTLEKIGNEFEVTRERIRQIEAKALKKMRHPSRSGKLKSYL